MHYNLNRMNTKRPSSFVRRQGRNKTSHTKVVEFVKHFRVRQWKMMSRRGSIGSRQLRSVCYVRPPCPPSPVSWQMYHASDLAGIITPACYTRQQRYEIVSLLNFMPFFFHLSPYFESFDRSNLSVPMLRLDTPADIWSMTFL